ncbi:unnamed protein product, partial [Cladocopium goreaui]
MDSTLKNCINGLLTDNRTSLNGFKRNGEHLKEVNLGSGVERPKVKRLRLTKEKSESNEKEHSEQSSQSDRKKEIGRIPRPPSQQLLKDNFYQDRLGTEKRKASATGTSQKSKDVEEEPPQPQYSVFSRDEVSPGRVGRGLQNLGNTCFFNSVLQVLVYTGPLQRFLLSKQHTAECKRKRGSTVCTLCLLQAHALKVFNSSKAPMKPAKRLLEHIPQIASSYKAGRQEDAHECLIHFLDSCHKSLLKPAAQQPVPMPVQQTTSICQLFGGSLRSQVLCLKCKHPSNTFDPFMDISLEVKNASTLEKALDAFTKSEQLSGANKYQCKKCQQKVDATKMFSIHTAPPVLSFQLKRFDFLHGCSGKLNKKVQFPVSLNIAPYTSHKDREAKYNLYGLVVHCGSSAKSGHYITYAKHNGVWHCFNDQDVRQVTEQQVLQAEVRGRVWPTGYTPVPPARE